MKKNQKGFSLVELIIVIAIMAVLIGLLAPQYLKFVKQSKVTADISNAASIADCFNASVIENVAITSPTTGVGGDTLTDIVGLPEFPYSKVDKTFVWKVESNSTDGVTKISLNNVQIYPDLADGSNAYFAAYY